MYYYVPESLPEPESDDHNEIECSCGTFWDTAIDESCPVCVEFIDETESADEFVSDEPECVY